ncbi:MAG: anti-sigma factor [Gammaproteobacteria bacterium]
MNYDKPQLRDLLAGEYVLAQLRGRARARFERLVSARSDYARAVVGWEERLAPLAAGMPPMSPPERVWRRIKREIVRDGRSVSGSARRRSLWPGFAVAGVAAAAFFVMLGLYLARPAPVQGPGEVAVIARQGAPRWVVTLRGNHMHMLVVGQAAPPAGKSYQLWMLPGGGGKPVSLGILPTSGKAGKTLSAALLKRLEGAKGLAVSLEPHGGSPTGQPTGPVVSTAQLLRT